MSFGKPGDYGKFYINSKETPVGNDVNFKRNISVEYDAFDNNHAMPSPWMLRDEDPWPGVYPCVKPRTEFPIVHPHAGGIRYHATMHNELIDASIDQTGMVATAGEYNTVFSVTKPMRMGYGDSYGIVFDIEMDPERGYAAVGVGPYTHKESSGGWGDGRLASRGGRCCMVRHDGASIVGDRDGADERSWDIAQCCPLMDVGGSHQTPPLCLSRAPVASHATARTPSPLRKAPTRQMTMQDGRPPTAGRSRLILSMFPCKNSMFVRGNDHQVRETIQMASVSPMAPIGAIVHSVECAHNAQYTGCKWAVL